MAVANDVKLLVKKEVMIGHPIINLFSTYLARNTYFSSGPEAPAHVVSVATFPETPAAFSAPVLPVKVPELLQLLRQYSHPIV